MINLDYKVNTELFGKVAEEWSERLASEPNKLNKKTQIRKFYERVLELEAKSKNHDFKSEIYPFVAMINSKVAYAKTRELVSESFVQMMKACISQVDSQEKLCNFKLFFEAVLGFYTRKD